MHIVNFYDLVILLAVRSSVGILILYKVQLILKRNMLGQHIQSNYISLLTQWYETSLVIEWDICSKSLFWVSFGIMFLVSTCKEGAKRTVLFTTKMLPSLVTNLLFNEVPLLFLLPVSCLCSKRSCKLELWSWLLIATPYLVKSGLKICASGLMIRLCLLLITFAKDALCNPSDLFRDVLISLLLEWGVLTPFFSEFNMLSLDLSKLLSFEPLFEFDLFPIE